MMDRKNVRVWVVRSSILVCGDVNWFFEVRCWWSVDGVLKWRKRRKEGLLCVKI
jgi:hypothetical protein